MPSVAVFIGHHAPEALKSPADGPRRPQVSESRSILEEMKSEGFPPATWHSVCVFVFLFLGSEKTLQAGGVFQKGPSSLDGFFPCF